MEQGCWGGRPSAQWKKSRIAERCCLEGSKTACYPCSQSGTILKPLMANSGLARWMSSLLGSRVSRSVSPVSEQEKTTAETSGPKPSGSFAKWDQGSACWKTYQVSLLTSTLEPFSGSWPRAGMVSGGIAYLREPLVRHTGETDYGLWRIPTPTTCDHKGSGRLRLERGANNNLRDYCKIRYGFLYPPVRVVEWLINVPSEWTDLKPLETCKFQQWLEQHGSY